MTEWGVPDWSTASAYPAPAALTDRQWRWQFLRRRPDYREAWERWAPVAAAEIERNLAWWEKQAARAGVDVADYFHVAATDNPDTCREQFQLTALLDPTLDFSDQRLFQAFTPTSGYGFTFKSEEASDWDDKNRRVGYMFDLNRPLAQQIDAAQEYLAELQAELVGKVAVARPHRENWPLYLRALDAKDAGVTLAKMASVFWPDSWRSMTDRKKDEGSARDTLKAAQKLRTNFPL